MFTETSREVDVFFFLSIPILDCRLQAMSVSNFLPPSLIDSETEKDFSFGTCRVSLYVVHTN